MKKLTKKALLDHLNKSEKEDIMREVITLFDTFQNVKEFYNVELSVAANPVLKIYKKKITQAYLATNPKERRTNMNINKLIIAFKKISIYQDELVDLLLHRVECGVDAFDRNNQRSETFYDSIFKSFQESISIIVAEKIADNYKSRIAAVIQKSKKGKYRIHERMEEVSCMLFI